jgi:hypothetical protein
MNLRSGMKDAIHTPSLIFLGSGHPRQSPGGRRSSSHWRSPGSEGAESEVINVLEVLPAVDVARWTRVASHLWGMKIFVNLKGL